MPYQKLGIEIAIDKVSLNAESLKTQIGEKLEAAVSGLNTALKVKVSADVSAAKTEITELTNLVGKFKQALNAGLDAKKFEADLAQIKKELAELAKGKKIDVNVDTSPAKEQVKNLKNDVADLGKGTKVKVEVDAKQSTDQLRQQFLKALDDISKQFKSTKLDMTFGAGQFVAQSNTAAYHVADYLAKTFAQDKELAAMTAAKQKLQERLQKYEQAILAAEKNPKFDAENPGKTYVQNESRATRAFQELRDLEGKIALVSGELVKNMDLSAAQMAKVIKQRLSSDEIGATTAAKDIKALIDEIAKLKNISPVELADKLGLKHLNAELVTVKDKIVPPTPPTPPKPPSGGGGDGDQPEKVDRLTALVKKLTDAFGLSDKAAETLRAKLQKAFEMEGVELGSTKLKKFSDMMVTISGETSKLSNISEAVKKAFASNPDAEIKLFSREKLDKELKAFELRVAELKDKATIAGVPTSGLQSLAKDTASLRANRLSSPEELDKLKDKYVALNTAVANDTKMLALGRALDGLGEKYASLGDAAQKVIGKVSGESFKNDAEGVAAFGKAIGLARGELERLATARTIEADRAKLQGRLDVIQGAFQTQNNQNQKLGAPLISADFAAAQAAIHNIQNADTATAARTFMDKLVRDLRAEASNVAIDFKVALKHEDVARDMARLQKDYDAFAVRNPGKVGPLDTSIDYSKPLQDVIRRAQEIQTAFQDIQRNVRLDKAMDATAESIKTAEFELDKFLRKLQMQKDAFLGFSQKRVVTDEGQAAYDAVIRQHDYISDLTSRISGPATKDQWRELQLANIELQALTKNFERLSEKKYNNPFMELLRDVPKFGTSVAEVQAILDKSGLDFRNMDGTHLKNLRTALKEYEMDIDEGTNKVYKHISALEKAFNINQYSLQNKVTRIDALEKAHPTLDVSGLRAQQADIQSLIGSRAASDVELVTLQLQLLSKAIETVKIEASGHVTVTFASQLQKAVELAYERIGDLTVNARATAAALNGALGSLGIKLDTQAKIDAATSAFRRYNNEVRNGTVIAKEANNAFGLLGDQMGKMATRLIQFYVMRTVLFAVGNQIREAAQAAVEFNQSMHDIIAISGDSRDQMREIGDSIWDIAKASRFTAKEVSELMQLLAQAGVKAEALPLVSKQVGTFATATATDPKLAADLVTTSMNVYNIDTDHTIRITNALTAALNNSKLEASGLATAFNYLAPQAAQLGYSMEQTLGIIATMAQSGVRPSTIGTGVSQMLKEFAAPKKRLLNLLDYYGLSAEDVNPLKHTFAEIVDALTHARGKANEMGVSVDHLFRALETRVGRSTVAALNLGGDAFRAMELSISNTSASLIAYDKSMEGAKARMNVLKQTLHELVSGSLELIAPALIGAGNALRGFLELFSPLGAAVVGAVATIGTLIFAISSLRKALLATAIVKSGEGFLAMILGGIANAPTIALIAGLAALGAVIYAVGNHFDKTRQQEEAARKARLESIETNQKMLDVLTQIRTENDSASATEAEKIAKATHSKVASLREYDQLMALHGERLRNLTQAEREAMLARGELNQQEKVIVELGQKKVNITTAQRAALELLIAKKPQEFEGIQKEIDLYTTLTQVIERMNAAKYKDSIAAMNRYNARFDSIANDLAGLENLKKVEKTLEDRMQQRRNDRMKGTNGGYGGSFVPEPMVEASQLAQTKKEIARREARKEELNSKEMLADREEAFMNTLSTTQPDPKKKGKTTTYVNSMTSEPRMLAPGFMGSRLKPFGYYDTTKDVTAGPDQNTNSHKDDSVATDLLPGLTLAELHDAKSELQQLRNLAVTKEEVLAYYKRVKAIDDEIAKWEKGKEVSQVAKQVKPKHSPLPNEVTPDSFDPSFKAMVSQVNKERGTHYTPVTYYQEEYAKAQAREKSARDKAIKEREKNQKEDLDKIEKVQLNFRQKLADLEQRDADELLAKQQANCERIISSATANEERKADALIKAKEIAAKRIDREVAAKGDKLIEDFYRPENAAVNKTDKGFDAMVEAIDRLYSDVPTQKAVANQKLDTTAINSSSVQLKSEFLEKQADRVLRLTQERLNVQKELANTSREVRDLELEGVEAEIKNAESKKKIYEEDLKWGEKQRKELADELVLAKEKNAPLQLQQEIQEKIDTWDNRHALRLKETAEKYEEILIKMGVLKQKYDDIADKSFSHNFAKGMDDAGKQVPTPEDFYKQMGNTTFNGVSDAVSNSLGTIFNRDDDKIADLRKSIADLNKEKAQLTADIAGIEANTSKTPQELQDLADKKTKLGEINNQLERQNSALRETTNAWASLAAGMKDFMKAILTEIQKYIAKLIVLYMWQQLTNLVKKVATSSSSGAAEDSPGNMMDEGNWGLQSAEGGMVPLDMGKAGVDSVPALLMPGEIIIKKSSVDYYGADRLLAVNDQRLKKFADGGMVGGGVGASAAAGQEKHEYALTIINVADPTSVPKMTGEEIVNVVSFDAAQKGPVYRTIRGVIANG